MIFADDLNAWRSFCRSTKNIQIVRAMKSCQARLHSWGDANRVEFDSSKESMTILSRQEPWGNSFKLLGVIFDAGLYMEEAICGIANKAAWRLSTLLRTRRFYTCIEMINLYKSRVLGFIECKTAAIYHAAQTQLLRLDRIQSSFLKNLGISETEALCNFRLAPLSSRRYSSTGCYSPQRLRLGTCPVW